MDKTLEEEMNEICLAIEQLAAKYVEKHNTTVLSAENRLTKASPERQEVSDSLFKAFDEMENACVVEERAI